MDHDNGESSRYRPHQAVQNHNNHLNYPQKVAHAEQLTPNEYTVCEYEFVSGKKKNSRLLYECDEKQLFSINAKGKLGNIYRCYDRKCPARRTLCDNGVLIKLHTAKPHNHATNQEQIYKNLRALSSLKSKCSTIESIAGGSKIGTVRTIFNRVVQE